MTWNLVAQIIVLAIVVMLLIDQLLVTWGKARKL